MNCNSLTRTVLSLTIFFLSVNVSKIVSADFLVSDSQNDQVLRFNEIDGSPIGAFVSNTDNGGLDGAVGMLFNTNGEFLVASRGKEGRNGNVLRYNGTTGAYLGVFANDLNASHMAFDAGGNILVSTFQEDPTFKGTIERFDVNGNSLGSAIDVNPDLDSVSSFAAGPDGNLYVGSFFSGVIYAYDSTGALISPAFASGYNGAAGLRFDGTDLWVSSLLTHNVARLGADGTEIERFSTGNNTFPGTTVTSLTSNEEILVALTGASGVYKLPINQGETPTLSQAPFMYVGGANPQDFGIPGEIIRVSNTSVPEPTALLPLLILMGGAISRRRR